MYYTIEHIADVVENEGLGYAVQNYISPDKIEDPKLREAWKKAGEYLDEIESILRESINDA